MRFFLKKLLTPYRLLVIIILQTGNNGKERIIMERNMVKDVNLLTPTERRILREAGFNLNKHARIVHLYNQANAKLIKLEAEMAAIKVLCERTDFMKYHRHTYIDTCIKIRKMYSLLNNTALTLSLSKRKLFNLMEKKLNKS